MSSGSQRINDSAPYGVDIPGYRILRKLGYGGMATVYLAEEARLGRQVALKIMSEDLSQGSNFAERFLAEGRMAAGLHHPNIVTIYNMGVAGDHYFIAMEHIDGEPLSARIKSGVPPEFAVRTAKRIAVALGSAHARGILHRDIKPSNILFRENRFAVLADFGIAKALESDSELTLAGSVLGTPSYMSPQQASGQKIDHRSDLYSLGVVLFEMLASKRPFMGDTPVATALKHATEPIPRLPQPIAHFQPIIDRILAKSPVDRFQDAEEFIQALDVIEVNDASPAGDRTTMVLDQDVVQSLWEASTDSSSGIEASTGRSTGGSLPSIKLNQLTNAFTLVKPKLAMVAGLILLALTIGKFIDWKTERDFQRRMAINEISVQAKNHVAESRFIEPEGNNAVAAYRKILELDSDNDLALKGLDAIEKKFEQEVADTKANAGPKQALSRVENVQHAFPDSPALNDLRTSIEQELAVTELKSKIAALMEKANQQESASRLTEPEGDNAAANFRKILRLDPDNAEARQGLDRIVARYQSWARDNKQAGDLAKALDMAEKGLRIAPEHAELLALKNEIRNVMGNQSRISALFDQARDQIAEDRLLSPKNDNAYATVREIERLDSGNKQAGDLRNEIVVVFLKRAQKFMREGDRVEAQETIRQGLLVDPEQAKLHALQSKLEEQQRHPIVEQQDAEQATRIKTLVNQAQEALITNRLTSPKQDNAVDYVREVLAYEPQNSEAQRILGAVITRYVGIADKSLARSNLNGAQRAENKAKGLAAEFNLVESEVQRLARRIEAGKKTKAGSINEIDRFLDKARKALRSNRLTKPKGDNTVEYAAQVLRTTPGHEGARGVLQETVGRYVVLGEVALNAERIDQAADYQQTAENLVKSYRLADAELQKLKVRLVAKRRQIELEKAQESAKSTATPIAGDGAQEREDEMKKLRQQLEEALRRKPEQTPKKKRQEVLLPPSF